MMPNTFAKRETFRKVFKSMKNEFRLIGGKGSFPTCDICNNANDFLRNLTYKDQSLREIILKFKRLHLMQQMKERQHMEMNRLTSRLLSKCEPVQFFCLIDAMTCSRGDVPLTGAKHRQSKGGVTDTIENRVIGMLYTVCTCAHIIVLYYSYILIQLAKSSVVISMKPFFTTPTIL
jgi:hypothetical protein